MILDATEHIIYEVRKHLLLFYAKIFGTAVFLIVLPVAYDIAVSMLLPQASREFLLFSMFAYLLLLLLSWIYIFISWTDYYLDTWIVTDSRVIDFELKGLFSRDIATVELKNIQDVKIIVDGFVNTMLHIGELQLQTAGSDKEFVIKNVHEPEKAKTTLMRIMAERNAA